MQEVSGVRLSIQPRYSTSITHGISPSKQCTKQHKSSIESASAEVPTRLMDCSVSDSALSVPGSTFVLAVTRG